MDKAELMNKPKRRKKLLKKQKHWMKFFLIGISMSIVGSSLRYYSIGDDSLNFLYENMIWFSIEIGITVIVINRLLQEIENEKEKNRFRRVAGKPTDSLIYHLKDKVVKIVEDRNIYDSNRKDTISTFEDVVVNIDNFVTEKLIESNRKYNFYAERAPINLNIDGILYVECEQIDNAIKAYLERFSLYLNDELYEKLITLERQNKNLGKLEFPLSVRCTDKFVIDGSSYEEYRKEISDYIIQVKETITLLEQYQGKHE